jgi:RND family efflux transporter MFP subunit
MSAISGTLTSHRVLSRRHFWIALGVLAALAASFLAGYLPRRAARKKLAAATPSAPVAARVAVTTAIASDAGRVLTLPAALSANRQTLVYARASGYVRRWLVDIGDNVKQGQLLLQLDTPELDQQLSQARAALSQTKAALAQANANREYAYVTSQREAQLFAKQLISAQENDQARTQASVWDANVNAAKANVAAQRAEVDRLQQLVSFGKVTAPFSGTITKRLVDVGTLVNAGAGTTAAALFEIAATDPMQAYVDVPQVFAPSVHTGAGAKVAVRNFRDRTFPARITRTAGALDPASRTLRTELELPNPKGELLAGMYVEVSLDVAVTHQAVRVPSSAIIADSRGVHVAVVDQGGQVHLIAVTTGIDDGNTIELVAGLSGGEQVISAPPSGVTDGMQVQAVTAK